MSRADPISLGLPHREPFLFVDAVLALQPGESAICEKTFASEEPFFRGHFPGDPLVPGVILAEALAQTAGIAAAQPGSGFRLAAIKAMKFLRPARPGDRLILSAKRSGATGGLWQFEARVEVNAEKVAEGVIVLSETKPS